MVKLNKVITWIENKHEEGLFPVSGHTRINGTSLPMDQAAVLKQAKEGAFLHSS